MSTSNPGQIVILNGAPRSGQSTIAAMIEERFDLTGQPDRPA